MNILNYSDEQFLKMQKLVCSGIKHISSWGGKAGMGYRGIGNFRVMDLLKFSCADSFKGHAKTLQYFQ